MFDDSDIRQSYASTYKDGKSTQKCTGAHLFTDDDPNYPMDIKMKQFYQV